MGRKTDAENSSQRAEIGGYAPENRLWRLNPARYVTVELAALLTGYSPDTIRHKVYRGIWIEGRQWVKRDGRVLIDLKGVELWHETGSA